MSFLAIPLAFPGLLLLLSLALSSSSFFTITVPVNLATASHAGLLLVMALRRVGRERSRPMFLNSLLSSVQATQHSNVCWAESALVPQ